MDMATPEVFAEMQKTALTTESCCREDCVDSIPIVAAREEFYGPASHITLDANDVGYASSEACAEIGDVVGISVLGAEVLNDRIQAAFRGSEREVQGRIIALWTVQHSSRKRPNPLESFLHDSTTPRQRTLVRRLSYVLYSSPTDKVTANISDDHGKDIEEASEGEDAGLSERLRKRPRASSTQSTEMSRRALLREQRKQTRRAWRSWLKPVLKPGDIVALLVPDTAESSAESPQGCDILLFVHRFWVENQERSRHIAFIESEKSLQPMEVDSIDDRLVREVCCPLDRAGRLITVDVRHSKMIRAHTKPRGAQKYHPVSSFGTLQNGESYFVYRFILYWDAFEFTTGKSASGDGFYLYCLNLPLEARSSANAVRVLSLAPPGVRIAALFDLIQEDLCQGASEGFEDIDAEGRRRRIFLDLVGVLGDTPALNEALDIMGHTSNACCHVCRFVRHSETIVGSRYADTRTYGRLSQCGRSTNLQRALRDCSAQKETCRLMGVRHPPMISNMPLHALSAALEAVRHHITYTKDGLQVVPGVLDPYKCCFIAPDHLLTGHMRDCLNLAFRLLPSRRHRQSCEQLMIGFLNDCDLPTQNRLYDHDRKVLFSMSMSEIYALGIVAEYAFIKGSQAERLGLSQPATLSDKYRQAVSLVGSAARLMASLWNMCRKQRSHAQLELLQLKADKHIDLVRNICRMSDERFSRMDDRRISAHDRKALTEEYNACMLSIRLIDKPNVHRLLELMRTTLPMVGHVSIVGELVLEKAHQSLKRAIRQSNNKLVHLQSLDEEIFNDWQGRLSMVVGRALEGDDNYVRFCLRLLSGRTIDPISTISPGHKSQVRAAIGPHFCIPALLDMAGRGVVSPKTGAMSGARLSWVLDGAMSSTANATVHQSQRLDAIATEFRRAVRQRLHKSLMFSDKVRAKLPNGVTTHSLRSGDFVKVYCYNHTIQRAQRPFLLCPSTVGKQALLRSEGPTFWTVMGILQTEELSREPQVWAALRPCHAIATAPAEHSYELHCPMYQIGDSISFARVHSDLRKVAKLHDCDISCTADVQRRRVQHSYGLHLYPGARVFLLSEKEGYPPRKG